ncbi:unnamed protein product [Adineta steineri]|uniref:Uncharacterized protein n=1 Tax=Adineta steineri TaxID=433720 RepID=A0A815KQW8_9BILA|nr:unnamed protein product [Adineta steineri]CAF1399713.1 unnamed protein product [Adineta steineri]CAF3761030.1 unnamed protein product [Adineta steineri]CAF3840572.1 unnamed protein product [Adineta steineri]
MEPLDAYEEEIFTEEKIAQLLNFNSHGFKFSGSSAEELFISFSTNIKSDIDMMFEFPHMFVIDPEQVTSEEREQCKAKGQYGLLHIEYNNKKYPCYVGLYFYLTQKLNVTNEKTVSSVLVPGTDKYVIPGESIESHREYFPSTGFVHWFRNNRSADENLNKNVEIHGPSVCITSNNPNLPLPIDYVFVLKCIDS